MKKVIIIIAIILILAIVGILIFGYTRNQNSEELSNSQHESTQVQNTGNDNVSTVYFTSDISSEGLMNIYQALGFEATGNVAVKVSTGESGGNYYLSPTLIKDLVQSVDGTIVECNTAYGGTRSTTEEHLQVAEEHGFTEIADVDILDANGEISLEVPNGKHITEDIVGENYQNYDSVIVLSHFKGHSMAGFGGAIKNISIGFASVTGKYLIHSGGTSTTSFTSVAQDDFLETMAEAASAIVADKGDNIVYINVMNNLSIDCDCDSNPEEPDMHDIGILASTDPVALDKACVDLVYEAEDGESLIERIESRNGVHALEYASEIGVGNLNYEMINIDEENTNMDNEDIKINLTVNDKTFSATLENNQTANELIEMFPLTINMSELNSNEKYYYLDTNLTTNSTSVSRINAGDIKLYGSNCLVVFYESFSTSYSYTNLGSIDDVDAFVAELGNGSVNITFELAE